MTNGLSYRFLADLVLVLHAGVVAFVVGGLLLVLIGNARKWQRVNAPWFRIAHLGACVWIAADAWLGVICPLTELELWLRSKARQTTYDGSFIEYWLGRLIYYDAPDWVFTLGYSVFGLTVLLVWWYFPPAFQGRDRGKTRIK